ncbi:MAG: hypothetical protein J6X62_04485, partial [Bacteroidales bacterium]|nr:hypothetical protein [Bacteroidales bacterium]
TTTVDSSNTADYYYRIVYNMRYGTTYYWRVRAYNRTDTSGWSAVRTLTTTDQVILNSPNDNLTGAYTRQQFQWNNSRGAKGYILELDTATDFSSPHLRRFTTTVDSSNTADYYYRIVYNMRYGTTYHWRVRAYNRTDTSGWSAVRTLTTSDRAYLNSPTNNASGQSVTNLSLYWNNSFGSKGYIIELDTATNFSSPLLQSVSVTRDSSNISTSYWNRSYSNLLYGTTYHWRVRSYNSVDTSGWSVVRHFTTAYNITTGPTLTMPANDSIGVAYNAVSLVWQSMNNMQGYHYEVSIHSTFDTLVASGNTTLTFATILGATPSTTYYWRVRGYNAQGNTQWSNTWRFITADVALTVPVHAAPADGASMTANVDIAWHPVFGAVTYDLQLALDNTFSGAVSNFSTADTHYVVSGLSLSTNYYWRVRSNNGNAVSAWSSPWSFTTSGCTTVTDTIRHSMCEGENYEFFGTTYSASGTHSHTLTSSQGCDSVVVLVLTVWPHGPDGSVTDTACNNYTWNGLSFTQSGDYPFYTTTVHGCDSMAVLHLTIYNSVSKDIYDTATGAYEWNGEQYSASGDYTHTFSTVHGCDSTVTLHLTVTADIHNIERDNLRIYVLGGRIVVEGVKGESVKLYDMVGRPVDNHGLPTGVYMVRVGNTLSARKVVVIR